jgi:heat shock protein HslJ
MNKIGIFFFVLVFALVSCNDDDNCSCSGDILGKWEASSFISFESVGYPKDDGYNPTIEFKGDGKIEIHLDANSCFGNYELNADTTITISDAGCTEMCCDSDFSNKFVEMLSQVKSYSIEDGNMYLNVPGWGLISLQYVSN